ncbi:MAG TPA: glycosyl hydrolase [Solirubrobacteraceae bacterium]|nr:glycosyl hydrolase [Solirubrobacteraceae bacterium]
MAASAAKKPPIAVGVNIASAPDQLAPMQSYAQIAGAKPAIVMWYQAWSEPLYYSDQLANMKTFGGVPMITWDPVLASGGVPLADIVNGNYDSYIWASARQAAAWGSLMYIRFGHEMNLSGSPFGPGVNGNTPAEFVAAWRHVVTIFRLAGATNVEWVWSPNVNCGGQCPFTSFYPGDSWVDWVALDGYNYSTVDNMPWMTFSQIFGPSYTSLESLTSKPVMIGETASAEASGSKATWITQAFLQQIPASYPNVHAVVWFDRDKETDWRVNSSASSLTAWDQVVSSSLYRGTPATLQTLLPTSGDVTASKTSTTSSTSGSASTTTTAKSSTSSRPGALAG